MRQPIRSAVVIRSGCLPCVCCALKTSPMVDSPTGPNTVPPSPEGPTIATTQQTTMFAVQPVSFGSFDEYGADYTPTIAAAYRIAGQRQADGEGDQMIWRLTTGEPIAWVRVYENESVDSVTPEALALLV